MTGFLKFMALVYSARLTLIIVIVVCSVILYKFIFCSLKDTIRYKSFRLNAWSVVFSVVATAVISVPVALAAGLVVAIFSAPGYKDTRWESPPVSIVALQDNVTSTGHIAVFLGSGGGDIDGSMTYFYAVHDDGGIRVISLSSPNVIIKEVPGATSAYLVSSGEESRQIDEKRTWRYTIPEDMDPIRYPADKFVFYVPPGTVDYKFKVDLK